ncbi:MAG: Exodeoxyribonuclease 7 large subunit [Candidatus Uhrbacteria bacterium GW2011_GWE2_40_58]|nr:MAG: Exodeoxyribonuclease 7 large subunit [Candidatus Uhrbacteria bacterium GW2011_GWF2_40_263]KKR68244.1 MAG: Exodeoxyribonuclease 7 large subunit [Candidatus Uhrbacteria bacterium GW2011_GWE2_40_58]OGL97505.1 MAG: exodeoxyribonuclease VII large subunit [Candidatus Uhrbacteria bacterium RIFOXYB2_FULL_41_18]HBK35108.1 exodeoxyribonuclease VII large subunit [Candidatus Uhrbacteria bacterium]HCB56251.1 exodeoxyribonuclease VII large subunit [Candidatus Uhrbacteria bacterium]
MDVSERQIVTVSAYLSFVNEILQETFSTNNLAIEGEVSDFRIAQQKWISFDLKDEKEQAVLKCFMTVWQLKIPLEDGMRVVVTGSPKVYERFGTFKLNVQQVDLVGEGALRRAYEMLKKKLEGEGLFAISHKRAIPRFPQRIGLITSRDAAAYGDFIRILNARWGGLTVDFFHVHVQGQFAVEEILSAFQYFNQLSESERPDVLVLTRGGGGLEDLHAFNNEQIARVVFQSAIPVICAVGHDRDESLCDFTADVRASTPSNAAERIVPNRTEILRELSYFSERLQEKCQQEIFTKQQAIERSVNFLSFLFERERQRIDFIQERLQDYFVSWLPSIQDRLNALQRFLFQVDPKRILARGYSIVTQGGLLLKRTDQLEQGGEVHVQLAQGTFDAEVLRINGKGKQKLF